MTTAEPPLESKRSPVRSGRNLQKLIEKARQTAAGGEGRVPQYLAPVPPDPAARRGYSFSRLTGMLHKRRAAAQTDPTESVGQPTLDPLGLGTLVHAVLAEVDFADPPELSDLVRRHAQRHLPEAGDGLDEPIGMVERFLSSGRAAEIAAAEEVHTELEFLLKWPPGSEEPSGRYLQGFIDCIYRDAGGHWRLLDYKTNRVAEDTLDPVAADYEMQMLVYALAVERILGRPPVELVLHFVRTGLEHHFPWNETARRRVVEMVDGAIQSIQ